MILDQLFSGLDGGSDDTGNIAELLIGTGNAGNLQDVTHLGGESDAASIILHKNAS